MNSGIFLINKGKGLSSNKAIQKIKRRLNIKKIGHFGTLDPLAEGLLICGINRGTKLSERFLNLDKSYFSRIMLGIKTTTDDSEGNIIEKKNIKVSEKEILETIKTFVGESKQKPPFFSALKYKGKPLYKYAREGKLIEKEPREIKIYKILDIVIENAFVSFKISCSKGTYIRSIARDLGDRLGCGGHLVELVRLSQGKFELKDAKKVDDIQMSDLINIENLSF
jgi:tRNA pseudouridine55 synthase